MVIYKRKDTFKNQNSGWMLGSIKRKVLMAFSLSPFLPGESRKRNKINRNELRRNRLIRDFSFINICIMVITEG